MDDFDYKKYSLQKLEDWVCDAISSGGATPQEVYDTIVGVIAEYHEHHKKGFNYTAELLSLLKGHRPVDFEDEEVYEAVRRECRYYNGSTVSSVGDRMPSYAHKNMEELSQYKGDKVKKWVLPVELEPNGECFVTFPDDLLEAANLEEGNRVEWIDRGDGSYLLKKVENKPKTHDEMIADGWTMTDDGFWIR